MTAPVIPSNPSSHNCSIIPPILLTSLSQTIFYLPSSFLPKKDKPWLTFFKLYFNLQKERYTTKLMRLSIKFRPNRPASPHLNGKVERSQKTDLDEFYVRADLSNFDTLREELAQWQFFYNWKRPHGSLSGKTPSQIVSELAEKTPFWDEVIHAYEVHKERIQEPCHAIDLAIRKLKRCL
jgi:hypothetical protein